MKKTKLSLVMAALCLIFNASAQQIYFLKGRVVTTDQRPLPGATIKQEKAAVFTNNDGYFNIATSKAEGKLNISYMGYKPKEVQFSKNESGPFLITLEPGDNNDLSEVQINAGYYTVKDKERTGSISRVTAETINKQPINNPLEGLIGRMAGVNIEPFTGVNGGGFKVEIRGRNSLRSDANEPLYLVDGVPYPSTRLTNDGFGVSSLRVGNGASPLSYLNPSDIESVEVLKDGDATAIYGSRGANGVILITTKKAKLGKTALDFNIYQGIAKVGKMLELLNTTQYLELRNEWFNNEGLQPGPTDYDVNGTWDKDKETDWQKVLIGGTAHNTSFQTGISGGKESTQFLFRGTYQRQTTVYPGSFADQKGSGMLTVNHVSVDKKFKANFSMTYGIDENKLPIFDLRRSINLAPNAPSIYNADGKLNWALNNNGTPTWSNPMADALNDYKSQSNSFLYNTMLNYELLPGFFLRSSIGYTNVRLRETLKRPIIAQDPTQSPEGANMVSINAIETWIVEPQLNYQRNLGKGKFDFLLGSTFQKNDQKSEAFAGVGYTSDFILDDINVAPIKAVITSATLYKYMAFFSRINYNYDGRYFINLTGRRDGSSRFGKGKQFANFGAIGAAWIFSSQNRVKNHLPMLSFGKLRTSYGTTGSDQIPDYGFLSTYTGTQTYQGESGLAPSKLANSIYSWETNRKFEIALDLGFINDKIMLSTSWYRNRSSNQLVGYNLPDVAGFPSVQYNLPATVQNTGWEFEINTANISNDTFSWKSSFNLTLPMNKLVSYPNIEGSSYANTYTVGKSLYTPKSYHYLNVDPQTGLYTFQDYDGSGTITTADKRPANKSLTSTVFGGLHNGFTLKNFSLDIFLQFAKKTIANPYAQFSIPGESGKQQPVQLLNRWKNPGDHADFQKISSSAAARQSFSFFASSDHFADASFIKLKNVSLSWNAPASWLKRININSLRIYVQGQNLYTLTDYFGDPELPGLTILPALRTITAGLQLGI